MCMGGKTHSKSYKPGDMRGRSGRCSGNPNTVVEVGFHLHRQPLRTVLKALASERSQGAGSHSVHKYSLSSVLLGTRLFFLLLLYFFLFRRLHIFLFQGCFFSLLFQGKAGLLKWVQQAGACTGEEAESWTGCFVLPASHRRRRG